MKELVSHETLYQVSGGSILTKKEYLSLAGDGRLPEWYKVQRIREMEETAECVEDVAKVIGISIAAGMLPFAIGEIANLVSSAYDTCSSLYNLYSDHFTYNEENGHYCCLS